MWRLSVKRNRKWKHVSALIPILDQFQNPILCWTHLLFWSGFFFCATNSVCVKRNAYLIPNYCDPHREASPACLWPPSLREGLKKSELNVCFFWLRRYKLILYFTSACTTVSYPFRAKLHKGFTLLGSLYLYQVGSGLIHRSGQSDWIPKPLQCKGSGTLWVRL